MDDKITNLIEQLRAKDSKQKASTLEDVLQILDAEELSDDQLHELTDVLIPAISDKNANVSRLSLKCITTLIQRYGEGYRLHLERCLSPVIDRLGDIKPQVREQAFSLLLESLQIFSISDFFERVAPACSSTKKNAHVPEQIFKLLATALSEEGIVTKALYKQIMPTCLQGLQDQAKDVRDAATLCIEEFYRNIGAPVKTDVQSSGARPTIVSGVLARLETKEVIANPVVSLSVPMQKPPSATPGRKPASATGVSRPGNSSSDADPIPPQVSQPRAHSAGPTVSSSRKPSSAGIPSSSSPVDDGAVEPIRVYTAEDLSKTVEGITQNMQLKGTDWTVRIAALRKLEGIVLGGAAEFPSFTALVNRQLKEPLCGQIQELRSQIVKQACSAVCAIARTLGPALEPCADYWIPQLLKQSAVSIQVIAEAATQAMQVMVAHVPSTRLLARLIEHIPHRSAVIRGAVANLLLISLRHWPSNVVEKNADTFEDAIRTQLSDAAPDVRSFSRKCYIAFARVCPARAQRLLSRLDAATQRRLYDDLNSHDTEEDAEFESALPFESDAVSVSSSVSSTRPSSRNDQYSVSGAKTPARPAFSARSTASSVSSDTPKHTLSSLSTPARQQLNSRKVTGAVRRVPASTDYAPSEPLPAAALSSKPSSGPQRVSRHTSSSSVAPPASQPERAHQHQQQEVVGGGARRVPNANGSVSAPASRRASIESVQSSAAIPPLLPKSESSRTTTATTTATASNNVNSFSSRRGGGAQQPSAPTERHISLSLDEILSAIKQAEWKEKHEAFSALIAIYSSPRSSEVIRYFDKVAEAHRVAVQNESHPKVLLIALRSLEILIASYRTSFELHIERTLPHLVKRAVPKTESEQTIAVAAECAISAIEQNYGPEVLLTIIQRLIMSQTAQGALPRTRVYTIELFRRIADANHSFFATAGPMKTWVEKFSSLTTDKSEEVRRASVLTLVLLHSINTPFFLSHLSQLPESISPTLLRTLGPLIPYLDAELSAFSRQNLPRSPSSNAGSESRYSNGMNGSPSSQKSSPGKSPSSGIAYSHRSALSSRSAYGHQQQQQQPPSSGSSILPPLVDNPPLTSTRAYPDRPSPSLLSSEFGRATYTSDYSRSALSDGASPHSPKPDSYFGRVDSEPLVTSRSYNSANDSSPTADEQILSSLSLIAASSQKKRGLLTLSRYCRANADKLLWRWPVLDVVLALSNLLRDEDRSVRDLAVHVLGDVFAAAPDGQLLPILSRIVSSLIEHESNPDSDVRKAADHALDGLAPRLDVASCAQVILPLVAHDNAPVQTSLLRVFTRVVSESRPHFLVNYIPAILPNLVEAFKSTHADVRKSVTFAIVEMYVILGDELTPYLNSSALTSSQLKLVTIYYDKRTAQKQPTMSSAQ